MKRKLIRAMKLADLSDTQQTWALILYAVHGLSSAIRYVNQIQIDRELEAVK